MNWIIEIALILLLSIAFVQDKKSRSIHLFVFAGLLILALIRFNAEAIPWNVVLQNAAFVLLIICCLMVYVSLREGRLVNIFKEHFGIGDLVFFLAVTPLFSSRNFIIYFITGIVFSGVTHLIVSQNRSGDTIPLAGYLSLYLIALRIIDLSLNQGLLYTDII